MLDGDEGIAGLKPWLDNLQFRVPRSSVIVVGTHLDGVSQAERRDGYEDGVIEKVYRLVSRYNDITCTKEMIMLATCSIAREHVEECKRSNYYVLLML